METPFDSSAELSEYYSGQVSFPTDKLLNFCNFGICLTLFPLDTRYEPVVLVACGSFSPVTFLHLRMFEMAMDRIRNSHRYCCIGGYFSPTNDAYGKVGLAQGFHRVKMCQLAVEDSSWIMVDPWEAMQRTWIRTSVVLDHFNYFLNDHRPPSLAGLPKIKVMLLAGGDLIESFGTPNLWSPEDLDHIVGRYGCMIIERTCVDLKAFLLSHDILYKYKDNILIAKQYIYNDINSTKIRLFIKRGMSIKYLLPDPVIAYIEHHGLYCTGIEPTLPLTIKDANP